MSLPGEDGGSGIGVRAAPCTRLSTSPWGSPWTSCGGNYVRARDETWPWLRYGSGSNNADQAAREVEGDDTMVLESMSE